MTQVYYHRVGQSGDDDQLFFHDSSHPKWLFGPEISEDGETLLLSMNESCDPVNRLYYFDLRKFDGQDVGTIGKGWGWGTSSLFSP